MSRQLPAGLGQAARQSHCIEKVGQLGLTEPIRTGVILDGLEASAK